MRAFLLLLLQTVSVFAVFDGALNHQLGKNIDIDIDSPASQSGISGLKCFEQDPYPAPRLRRIQHGDCMHIVSTMRDFEKGNAPMHFSRNESRGYHLPSMSRYGTCMIGLDFVKGNDETEEEDMPLTGLAHIIQAIILVCVDHYMAHGYGGGHIVGAHDRMAVMVIGVEPKESQEARWSQKMGGVRQLTPEQDRLLNALIVAGGYTTQS